MAKPKEEQKDTAVMKPPAPSPMDDLVEAWFVETFHNIGLDAPLYNRFHAAKLTLKTRLAALVVKEK